jgi:hypothetical protein
VTAATRGTKQDAGFAWNGFGAGLANARFQDRDGAGFSVSDVPRLQRRWAFGLGVITVA